MEPWADEPRLTQPSTTQGGGGLWLVCAGAAMGLPTVLHRGVRGVRKGRPPTGNRWGPGSPCRRPGEDIAAARRKKEKGIENERESSGRAVRYM